ncbi:apolipoprotein N-acyltransferase [Georgenia halophila]|uniref:apolipoprotein N-acyltransferase n=1 Tax=Georgenia halophila TaxID=620889 RepID=UPI0031F1B36F
MPPTVPSRSWTLLLAAAGGLATDTAFPGKSWWPMAYVGIALLLLALRRDSVPWGWFVGWVWGLGFFLPHLWWANHAVGEPIGWVALSLAEAAVVGCFGAAAVLVRRAPSIRGRPWAQVLAVAVLWVAAEQLRARWPFEGFPWGLLAFSQTEAPLLRLASVGSTVAVSGVVVVIGAALAHAVTRLRRLQVGGASAMVLVAAACTFGPWLIPLDTQPESGSLRVGAVQGGVPEAGADATYQARDVTANHAAGTEALLEEVAPGELDLVLWPESSADIDPRTDPDVAQIVDQAARAVEAPILLGTQRYLQDPEDPEQRVRYNELILWQAGSGAAEDLVYAKQHPVPFGEYMPHRDFFRTFTEAVDLITVDMVAGDEMGLLKVPVERMDRAVPISVGICFEVAYDQLIRESVVAGGELIVIPTNNASFGMTQESTQQLAMSRFRAVEHGRAVAQVSTVGVSGIITPNGVYTDTTELWTAEQMVETMPLRTSLTLADRLGQWPALVTGALAALGVLAGVVGSLRRAGPGGGGARTGGSSGGKRSGGSRRGPSGKPSRGSSSRGAGSRGKAAGRGSRGGGSRPKASSPAPRTKTSGSRGRRR